MANEIDINITIRANINGAEYSRTAAFVDSMTGSGMYSGMVAVSTSHVQLPDIGIGTYGWMFIKNLAPTAGIYVSIRHDDDDDDIMMRVYAGKSCLFKTHGLTAIYAKANTSTQILQYTIIEL